MSDPEERLIERWMPINEISVEAIREGGALAGHPPVNQLHVWWARRPLIASRAAVATSILPATADREQFISNLGTTPEVVKARNRMDAIKAEGGWSDVSFPNKRAFLHNPEFLTENPQTAPFVLDLTAGGGSIPFEAGRLETWPESQYYRDRRFLSVESRWYSGLLVVYRLKLCRIGLKYVSLA